MNGVLTNVKLKVLDPKGKVQLENETKSTVAGSFQFTFKLTGNLKGTNEAYLSTGYMSEPVKVTLNTQKKTRVKVTISNGEIINPSSNTTRAETSCTGYRIICPSKTNNRSKNV